MQRAKSLEKILLLGNIEGRRRGQEVDMFGWHCRLNEHEFEQTLGDSERQGSKVCCWSWGHQESDMTSRLKNNKVLVKEMLIDPLLGNDQKVFPKICAT